MINDSLPSNRSSNGYKFNGIKALNQPHTFPTLQNFLKRCGNNTAICRLGRMNEGFALVWVWWCVWRLGWDIWKWGITIWIMLLIRCEWIIKTRCWRWLRVDVGVRSASSCVQKEKSWRDSQRMNEFSAAKWHGRRKEEEKKKSSGCCRKAKVNLNKSELCKSAQGTRCCWVGWMLSVACLPLFPAVGVKYLLALDYTLLLIYFQEYPRFQDKIPPYPLTG